MIQMMFKCICKHLKIFIHVPDEDFITRVILIGVIIYLCVPDGADSRAHARRTFRCSCTNRQEFYVQDSQRLYRSVGSKLWLNSSACKHEHSHINILWLSRVQNLCNFIFVLQGHWLAYFIPSSYLKSIQCTAAIKEHGNWHRHVVS